MKRNIIITIAMFAASAAIVLSCGKDYTHISNDTTYPSLQSALSELAVMPKTVTLNATTGGSFRGNSGTRYVFPPNAFKTSSGALVTGDVQVEVTEYLNKVDMLCSGVLPMTNTNETLVSGGESQVNATQNGQPLSLQGTSTYQIHMPQQGTPDNGMQVYSGHADPGTGYVNWSLNSDSSSATISYNGDTTILTSDSFNYVNADHLLTPPNYQDFTINLSASGAQVGELVMTYALYDGYNAATSLENRTGTVVTSYKVSNLPLHFVAIALINGKFYGGILGATPTTGSTYNLVLKPTTPSAFKALIKAL